MVRNASRALPPCATVILGRQAELSTILALIFSTIEPWNTEILYAKMHKHIPLHWERLEKILSPGKIHGMHIL